MKVPTPAVALAVAILGLSVPARAAPLTPEQYGAAGSLSLATGTIAAGAKLLTLAAPLDFAGGQGIRIDGAGPAPKIGAATGVTATPQGRAGRTRYCYRIAALDGQGGGTAASAEACTSAAPLSATNRIRIAWAAPISGPPPAFYAVYGRDGGAEVLIAVTTTTSLLDFGGSITGWPWSVDWLPARPPGAAFNDYLVTTVASGAGTRTLTLAAPASAAVTGAIVAHDDTASLQAMFTAAGRSKESDVLLGPACYPITAPLLMTPATGGPVILHGRGSSYVGQIGSKPRSCIIAEGGGAPAATPNGMIHIGAFGQGGATQVGGEIADLDLIAQAIMQKGVFIEDAQAVDLDRLAIQGAASDGVYITNSLAMQTPTREIRLDRVSIHEWGTSTPDANCIGIQGRYPGGAGGVTLSKFSYVTCDHEWGSMFNVGQVGDAMHVVNPFEFAPPWVGGHSIDWSSDTLPQVNGTWSIAAPVFVRSINVGTPQAGLYSFVDYAADSPDTQSAQPVLVTGPGAANVAILDSFNGERGGDARTLGLRNIVHHDRGMVMTFNAASNLLLTADGAYATGGTGYFGGYIGTSGSPGGGISITTPPHAGDSLWIADSVPISGTFSTAVPLAWNPAVVVTTNTLGVKTAVIRFGFICDTHDPPLNGVYVEASAAHANYQLVVANAGVYARADTGIALSNAPWQYRLDVTYGQAASLSMRQIDRSQFTLPTFVLNSTLAIPNSACAYVAWIKSSTGAAQTLIQYDEKIGYQRP